MIYIVVLAIILYLAWRMMPSKGVNSMTTKQLKEVLNDSQKYFIDVRTPAEFKARNIKQFKNIPLGSDFSKLPKDKEIVVICQSGMRSSQAAKKLTKLGYKKVTNVRGGMSAYRG